MKNKQNKNLKKFILTILLTFLFAIFNTHNIFATNKEIVQLDYVKMEKQSNDNLCGMYSLSSMFRYLNISNDLAKALNEEAENIPVYINGDKIMKKPSEIGTYVEHLSELSQKRNHYITIVFPKDNKDKNDLPFWVKETKEQIDKGNPVMAVIGKETSVFHAVVITGYNDIDKTFTIYNSWYDYITYLHYDKLYITDLGTMYELQYTMYLSKKESKNDKGIVYKYLF